MNAKRAAEIAESNRHIKQVKRRDENLEKKVPDREIANEATLKAAAFGELAVKEISELLVCYDLSDIYCCDEVGFPLKVSFSTKRAGPKYGNKIIRPSQVTILLCCNALGYDKCKPFVISRRFPKGLSEETLNRIEAQTSQDGRINQETCTDWLHDLDKEMQAQGRRIALIFSLLLKYVQPKEADLHNIDIIRMPRGQDSKHPLALGIAKAFRVLYTEKMLKVTYNICDRQSKSSEKVKNSTLWSYFATSWDDVSIPSIRYCFSRSPVMPAPHKTHLNCLTLQSNRFITELETMLKKTYKTPDDYDLCYYFISIDANTPESYMHDSTMEAIYNTTGLKERDDQDFVDEDDVDDFDEQ